MDGTETRLDRPWREVQGREKPYLLSDENRTLLTRNQSPHASLQLSSTKISCYITWIYSRIVMEKMPGPL